MYYFSFLGKVFRKANFPILIYLFLNLGVITGIMYLMIGGAENGLLWSFLSAIVIYTVSLIIALSPVGEFFVRWQTGCYRFRDPNGSVMRALRPLFQEVEARARRADPSLPRNIRLYIIEDNSPNAFATGRKTICVTTGLLSLPTQQIRATLAHEFGHLSNHDTDLILLVTVGNLFVTATILFIKGLIMIVYWIFYAMGWFFALFMNDFGPLFISFIAVIYKGLTFLFVDLLTWIWTSIGTLLCMKTSRDNEYEADEFAFNLGYGSDLASLLQTIGGGAPIGLMANLAASHPASSLRIQRLRTLSNQRRAMPAQRLAPQSRPGQRPTSRPGVNPRNNNGRR